MRIKALLPYQKSSKDYVDRNAFITIRDKETTCIKYQQDLDLPRLALDVSSLGLLPKNQQSRRNRSLGFDLFSILCTNHSRKTWSSHEVG